MTEFEKWLLIATAIGTLLTVVKTFVLPLIRREKLTVTLSRFGVDQKRNNEGKYVINMKTFQVIATFTNSGNRQASLIKIDLLYNFNQKGEGARYRVNDEFKIPKVLEMKETFPLIFEEDVDFNKMEKEKLQKLNLWLRIYAISSKGIPVIRKFELAEIKIHGGASSINKKNFHKRIVIFNNVTLWLRKKNKSLNDLSDPFF